MKSIAVFCGSSAGANPIYAEVTKQLGEVLVAQDITLVYGAGNVGLMGVIADAVLDKGGKVIGTIPKFLEDKEVAHYGITELIVTDTMHQRKEKMAEVAEGILVLPGGIGTLDEFFEIFTWQQLGLHTKPIGLLNINGYYNYLLQHIEYMVQEEFLKPYHRDRILVAENPTALIAKMKAQKIEYIDKWWVENE